MSMPKHLDLGTEILNTLKRFGAMETKLLAKHLGVDYPIINKYVKDLEDVDLIKKDGDLIKRK